MTEYIVRDESLAAHVGGWVLIIIVLVVAAVLTSELAVRADREVGPAVDAAVEQAARSRSRAIVEQLFPSFEGRFKRKRNVHDPRIMATLRGALARDGLTLAWASLDFGPRGRVTGGTFRFASGDCGTYHYKRGLSGLPSGDSEWSWSVGKDWYAVGTAPFFCLVPRY